MSNKLFRRRIADILAEYYPDHGRTPHNVWGLKWREGGEETIPVGYPGPELMRVREGICR